jgi:DNA-binding MarR family transcriptional regulator
VKPEETIDFHVRWAWLKISKMYNQEANKYGITQGIGFILLNIDPKEGTPSTQLGPKMGMEPTSLSRTIKSMEEKDLIKRVKDKNDRRVMRIVLTSAGERMREVSRASVVEFNERILKDLSKEKVEHFKEVIELIDRHTLKEL